MLLNNEWANKEIEEEIKRYFETNENENRAIQNLWDTGQAILRGKFIALQAYLKKTRQRSSSQDGVIGRNPLLPHATKRRVTTNLTSINNQKFQKIKLHGTLTTKELKKQSTRTTRPVRWQMERTHGKAVVCAEGAG